MRRASFEREQYEAVRRQQAERNAFVQHDYEEPNRPERLNKRDRRVAPQGDLTVGEVTVREQRKYPGKYITADVVKTGLPMWMKALVGYDGSNDRKMMYRERRTRELREQYPGQSRTERKRLGYPVKPGEKPIGWLKVNNGYVPLFEETERVKQNGT